MASLREEGAFLDEVISVIATFATLETPRHSGEKGTVMGLEGIM